MSINYSAFHKISLFSGYSEQELSVLTANSLIKSFQANTIIIHESDLAQSLYFIIQGAVRVFGDNTRGKEVTLNELNAGDMFGELAWLSNNKRSASVITKQHTKLLIVQYADFEKFYACHPEVSFKITEKYAEQIARLSDHLETVALENIQQKVIWAIKSYAHKSDDGASITSVTHKELANLIGSSRESVSRAIQELKQSGQISVKNGCLYVDCH